LTSIPTQFRAAATQDGPMLEAAKPCCFIYEQ